MASAAFSLQTAIYARLLGDTALTAMLGGPRIYDDVPQRADFPYLTFGQSIERDWSTGTEDGKEHSITLHVWSRAAGRKESDDILEAVRALLHGAALVLAGHRLVNLRHEVSDVRRDPDGETYHGTARFRGVTEPI